MSIILLFFKQAEFSADRIQKIKELLPDREVLMTEDRAAIESRLGEIEIVAGHVPTDLLLRMPNLVWYQQWGAGADWLLRSPAAVEKDWTLVNASGVHAVPISEHIFGLLLGFGRGIQRAVALAGAA